MPSTRLRTSSSAVAPSRTRGLDDGQRERILALAGDFPRLWNDPATPHRERKRMARFLIEDVTVTKAARSLGVRLRGGAKQQLTWVPDPHTSDLYRTSGEVVAEIDRLLDDHTDGEVARILNEHGHRSGYGLAVTPKQVRMARRRYQLKSRSRRLRDRGFLQSAEIAERLGVAGNTVHNWRKAGLLREHVYCDAGHILFEIPDPPPEKRPGQPLSRGQTASSPAMIGTDEVKYGS